MKLRRVLWRTAGGLARLVRPLNCVMLFVGTFVGGIIVDRFQAIDWPVNRALILASLSAALVGAGANAINDVFDVAVDSVNRPSRPIPAGAVTVKAALATWIALSLGGIAIGFTVSVLHGIIAAGIAAVMYVYSGWLKSVPLAGNVIVGATVSLTLVYGALAFGPVEPVVPALVFAFLTNLARELIKDVQDLEGDAVQQVKSLPVKHGQKSGVMLFAALVVATIVLTPVPYVVLGYGGLYLLLVLFADGALVAALWAGVNTDRQDFAGRASALVKVAMVFGLGALSFSDVVG